jgi:hypothetical protein
MKTHELTGADLNEAVAKCLGIVHTRFQGQAVDQGGNPLMYNDDWSLAGEIIERERISVNCVYAVITPENQAQAWCADDKNGDHVQTGPTPLIAAMRCYVASKQGELT